ncbi:MAG: BBP7 family outer membrane beta-barrel protein [Planctomycetaceae bacterium]|nr:BBP7 family outer membrane beta-barrel protein [Planctomycetaceae bacterium]
MRLWAPVRSEQFGGNARLRDGMWGEVSYNYMLITKGKNTTIGWVADQGLQNTYFTGTSFNQRTNNMTTGSLGNNFNSGVTLRLGNFSGHHGWEIASTIMQSQRDSYEGVNGTMDIQEDSQALFTATPKSGYAYYYKGTTIPQAFESFNGQSHNVGFFWGWYAVNPSQVNWILADPPETVDVVAPMPLNFDLYKIDSKLSHWDIQANYIFRSHATRLGFLEFTGGVRYLELDDNLSFTGWGSMWNSYVEEETDSSSTDTDNNNYVAETSPYQLKSDTHWHFTADNHLIGPQVGIRLIRKTAGRWSLTADSKFFAGFNTQNVRSRGNIGASNYISTTDETNNNDNNTNTIPTLVPIGFINGGKEFNYRKTLMDFSPGVELALKASWQFTDAIALQAGYQGMWIDNTARASLVNKYAIDHTGNIFGINDKVTQSTWIHGVNIGIVINR